MTRSITDENENDSLDLDVEEPSPHISTKFGKITNSTNIDGKVIKSSKKEKERLMNRDKDTLSISSITRKAGRQKLRSKSKSPSTSRSRSGSRKGRLKKRLSNGSIKSLPAKRPTTFKISFDSSDSETEEEEEEEEEGEGGRIMTGKFLVFLF